MNWWARLSSQEQIAEAQNLLIAFGVLVATLLILQLVKRLLYQNLKKLAQDTGAEGEGLLSRVARSASPLSMVAVAVWTASLFLDLGAQATSFVTVLVKIAFFFQLALWGTELINFYVQRRAKTEAETNPAAVTTLNAFSLVGKVLLWSVISLLVLENLTGIQIDTLIASLGITGVAVALAVQNILGDLFASVSIAMDQPFVIGDFIIVDDLMGTVEHVGLKSTRVRSISGEQLVFSNSDLLASRIRNYKRMARRRMLFHLNIAYGTPPDQLEMVPQIIERIVSGTPDITFDRAHLMEFGQYAFRYEVVCYVETADYRTYMDRQQEIMLEIYRCLMDAGIDIAYPTSQVFVRDEFTKTLGKVP